MSGNELKMIGLIRYVKRLLWVSLSGLE